MKNKKIKIMIVDDFALIRDGLKNLLELDGSMKVISEAQDGIDCLNKLNEKLPDILLLDINMPNKNGLDVLQEIRSNEIPIKVMILTMHNEIDYLLRAIEIGADGYASKNIKFEELKEAIDLIIHGENFIQKELLPLLNSKIEKKNEELDKIKSLTKRELEVLKNIAFGNSNREIATSLKISERTVKNHIFNIFKKIAVTDRTQAAVFAIRNDLISLN
ncbi:MAG: DNA-binding response regulator [Lachnospiraceae bacterium]|jgi:two-component system response regulator DegU|nr:DNA-binding response regulator [Lachnospiraceae bacterium]